MMILITFILVLFLDQLTKYLIVSNFILHQSVPIIEDIFHLTYVRNYGAAFGILQGQRLFFLLVTLVVVALLIYFYRQLPLDSTLNRLALGLALGGAIGNLVDRIRLGYVVDFFDFRVWPVFNIADAAIVIAVVSYSYWMFFLEDS